MRQNGGRERERERGGEEEREERMKEYTRERKRIRKVGIKINKRQKKVIQNQGRYK